MERHFIIIPISDTHMNSIATKLWYFVLKL